MTIISASRRTDIPAFHSDWFYDRLGKDVIVANPFNPKQNSRISLAKDDVDCFVFWTKNVSPFLERIDELDGYDYYFQYTVNCYGNRIEPNVPDRNEVLDSFIALSERIGSRKVIWRYDPILIDDEFSIEWHISNFRSIAEKLYNHTERCVISFIDIYRKNRRKVSEYRIREPSVDEIHELAENLSDIAEHHSMELFTCSESFDLKRYGIKHGKCIDDVLIKELFNKDVNRSRDDQRDDCCCVKCRDIGSYDTCGHGCIYCYANR